MRPHRAPLLFYSAAGISVLAWCAGFSGMQKSKAPAVSAATLSDAARMKQLAAPEPLRKLVEQALALPEMERGKALDKAMAKFARQVSAEDAEWLLELRKRGGKPGISDEQWNQFLTRWTGAEPKKVGDFLEGHGLLAGADASSLLKAWARGNAPAILDWIAAGSDKRRQWWASQSLAFGADWAAHDLDGALTWIEKGTGDSMEYTIMAALEQKRGIQAVAEWLDARGDQAITISSTARSAAVGAIVQHTLKTDGPEAAARWVEGRTRADEITTGLYAVRAAFTAAAPEKALTWLDGLASREGFPRAEAEAAMNQWVATDSGAAGDWLNAHRASPAFKEYVWAYAMNVALENPDAARKWAALLPAETAPRTQTTKSGFPAFYAALGTLEQHIDAAANAVVAWSQPPPPLTGQTLPAFAKSPVLMRYNPVLVRESPGAEPTVRMVPKNPFG